MKKLLTLLFMTAMVMAVPILNNEVYSVTPSTVQPGQDFTLEMSIKNVGDKSAEDITATLETTSAFELKPQSDAVQSLSSLAVGDTFRPEYDLIASGGLKSGTYEMSVEICSKIACSTVKVPITVRGSPLWGISESSMGKARVGETLPAKITLKNFGTGISDNVEIEVVGDDEEIIVPLGKTKFFFEKVNPSEEIELDMGLFVNAPEKTSAYALQLKVTYDNESGTRSQDTVYYWINVEAPGEALKLVSYSTEPEVVKPGDIVTVLAKVKNTASSAIKDVTMTIPSTSQFSPVGLAKVYIGDIEPMSETEYEFKIAVKGDTEPDTYSLALSLDYANAQKEAQSTVTETLGISIMSPPSLSVSLRESTPPVLIPGQKSTATLEIANTGASTAYYLVIEPTNGYDISPHSVYIGNLNPDDYDSVDFEITPPADASSSDTFEVRLSYKDGYNLQIEEIRPVSLRTVSKAEGARYNSSGISATTAVLLLAVLVGGGWYLKKRFSRKR